MIINIRQADNKHKWIAYVWDESPDDSQSTYTEEVYVEINDWCKDQFKYHARTAYNIFEFKKRSDLEWFVLKWS